MTRLINKETMNLKATPPKRLLLMETMIRANGSYSCQIQAPPTWPSTTDPMTIKTDPQKIKRHSSTNKLFRFSFDESNNPQPMTHWRERERKRAAEEGDKTEKLRDREKRTYRHRRPHCSMREKRWSVYIYIYI